MPNLPPRALRRSARDLPFSIFLVAVVLSLLRARDLPSVDVGAGGTELSIGPADLALAVLAVFSARRLRERGALPSRTLLIVVAAFATLIVGSAIPNGAVAITAAGKLSELAVLTLGAAAFLDTRERLTALAQVLVGFCAIAVAWGAVGFVRDVGGRQGSFLGEHDLAALGTVAIAVGLAAIHAGRERPGAGALATVVIGGLAIMLGASLASLLGLYLAAGAVLALAAARRSLHLRSSLVTIAVVAAVSAGTIALRSGELGFLKQWFGPEPERAGQYAASWSQRLIYAYVGGRIFLDKPVLGTGWHGELPPAEYARYLPDARERFSDQPPRYFPPEDRTFIPQQTYDQVLFELGLVGVALLLALGVIATRLAVRVGRRWPPEGAEHASLPAAWLAGLVGALAGAALFGGSPLAALFWLTLGVVAAAPSLLRETRA